MREAMVIGLKEVKERKMIFFALGVCGVLPLLVGPLNLFGLTATTRDSVFIASILVMLMTAGVSMLTGATLMGRELAEKRMSFFFARPVSTFKIWSGKVLAGLVIAMGSGVLGILPSLFFHPEMLSGLKEWHFSISVLLGTVVLPFSFGIVLGIVFSSRSYWLIADILAVPLTVLLTVPGIRKLVTANIMSFAYGGNNISRNLTDGTMSLITAGAILVAVILISAALPASYLALRVGRSDIKRVHKALSISLWSLTLVGLLSFNSFVYWVVKAAPSDIRRIEYVEAAPTGNWVLISGNVWTDLYYSPAFLLNTETGAYLHIDMPFTDLIFTADGKRVYWLETEDIQRGSALLLKTAELGDGVPVPEKTKLKFSSDSGTRLYFDDNSSRMAAINNDTVTFYEVPSLRELGTVALDPAQKQTRFAYYDRAVFRSQNLFTLFMVTKNQARFDIHIYDFDLGSQKMVHKGSIESGTVGSTVFGNFYVESDRVLLTNRHDNDKPAQVSIFNSHDAAKVADFEPTTLSMQTRFLSSGRIAVPYVKNGEVELLLTDMDGKELKTIALGKAKRAVVGGEVTPSKLAFALLDDSGSTINAVKRNFIVDLETAQITATPEKLTPLLAHRFFFTHHPMIAPNANISQLYYSHERLESYDFNSGSIRTILKVRD